VTGTPDLVLGTVTNEEKVAFGQTGTIKLVVQDTSIPGLRPEADATKKAGSARTTKLLVREPVVLVRRQGDLENRNR
jgi:hypothetical protein